MAATEKTALAAEFEELWVQRLLRFVPVVRARDERPASAEVVSVTAEGR
jgi:hypothetical protein